MVSTNAIVILVFFSTWTLVEFHSFFRESRRLDTLQILLEINSVVLFFASAGIWFFRGQCDGPMDAIENAVLQCILFSPLTFLASRFKRQFTSVFGLLVLSVSAARAIWPARGGYCGAPLLSIAGAISLIMVFVLSVISHKHLFQHEA